MMWGEVGKEGRGGPALRDMGRVWAAVFARPSEPAPDVDQDLYCGFVGDRDRRLLDDLRASAAGMNGKARVHFDDPRLVELFWRYRARNFPATLAPEEAG